MLIPVVLLIAWLYWRVYTAAGTRDAVPAVFRATLISTAAGIAGGLIGSIMLMLFGVDLASVGMGYLFVLALLLACTQARFICVAYAGGLLSLTHLVFNYPVIDVSQLMALVAILHMVEAVLIFFTGGIDPVPVYLRHPAGTIGGFNLQRFWPIPLIALMSGNVSGMSLGSETWWPLLGRSFGEQEVGRMLLPFVALLGYGETTSTTDPVVQSRHSAVFLGLYSLLLMALALAGTRHPMAQLAAAMFGPLGHEAVIALNRWREESRPPLYIHDGHGVMVLDVERGSVSEAAGIRRSDVILTVNGIAVSDADELAERLRSDWAGSRLGLRRSGQDCFVFLAKRPNQPHGLILIPPRHVIPAGTSGFAALLLSKLLQGRKILP